MLLIELARRDAFQADPARLSGLLSVTYGDLYGDRTRDLLRDRQAS